MSIQRLDQTVADAIAAGEVVERPASVVKELVENSIDAGATRVTIEIDGAGVDRILVADDGAGIGASELALAFMRHATSKLSSIAELSRIESLGFRGEALASIAAVSRVELRSTPVDAAEGAALRAEWGVLGELTAAPPVRGTRVEVTGLFENTPARRAFLKRPATEASAVVKVLVGLAVCHPDIAFSVSIEGRRSLETAGDGDAARVLRSVLRGTSDLLEVRGERDGVVVSGMISEPSGLRRSREHLYLSVNGRPVVSRNLAFAVEQAYRGLAGTGLFPVGALSLTLAAESVDVNVHPTKREVRFRAARAVFGTIQESCLVALSRSAAYAGSGLLSGGSELREGATGYGSVVETPRIAPGDTALAPASAEPGWLGGLGIRAPARAATGFGAGVGEPMLLEVTPEGSPAAILRGPFRLVGQVLDSYIVAEGPSGLVLVDQHAAHERVLFNRLVAARSAGGDTRQPMLVPALLHLSPAQSACLDDCRADLAAAGLDIEDFGGGAARLVGHDPALPSRHLDRIVLDVIDSLVTEGPEADQARRLERAMYTVACQSAIKFGQRLSREEMEAVLRALEVADPGITCPHGRPTLLEITDNQLRREFRRS